MDFEYIKNIIKINLKKEKIADVELNKRKCYIMMACNYGNIGDVAITIAQKKFLEKYYKNSTVIEVPLDKIYLYAKDIKSKINKRDLITIIGGGNSGNVYPAFEKARRFIAKYFKDYHVVSFPQTVDFTNDYYGKKELNKSIKCYKDTNIVFFAREEKSYNFYKNNFKNESFLVPDIVLSLEQKKNLKRHGVVLCFRDDKELVSNSIEIKEHIEKYLKEENIDYIFQDTYIGDIEIKDKNKELNIILDVFRKSELVITDRLHGMIFCAITGTPCVALNNLNKKVEYTYKKWLNKVENIKFYNYDSNIENVIEKILLQKNYNIEIAKLKDNYRPLIDELDKEM